MGMKGEREGERVGGGRSYCNDRSYTHLFEGVECVLCPIVMIYD